MMLNILEGAARQIWIKSDVNSVCFGGNPMYKYFTILEL